MVRGAYIGVTIALFSSPYTIFKAATRLLIVYRFIRTSMVPTTGLEPETTSIHLLVLKSGFSIYLTSVIGMRRTPNRGIKRELSFTSPLTTVPSAEHHTRAFTASNTTNLL